MLPSIVQAPRAQPSGAGRGGVREQDQVGGLWPGFKECSSARGMPLHVTTRPLQPPPDFAERFGRHLVLVYTGVARLARNLLQDVLRRWHARLPLVADNIAALQATEERMREAVLAGDVEAVGRNLSDYWEQKKCMAPGAEPPRIAAAMAALRDLCWGMSLAGAGGGGFLVLVTRRENLVGEVAERLAAAGFVEATVHAAAIDGRPVGPVLLPSLAASAAEG